MKRSTVAVQYGPRFEASPEESALIKRIVARATIAIIHREGRCSPAERVSIEMDVTATHLNICHLDLERLLAADDFNFGHDVFGIVRHLDREKIALMNYFRPRFASRDARVGRPLDRVAEATTS